MVARDPEIASDVPTESGIDLLRRADELLEMAEHRRHLPR
jgi:hypothetical protein